jgi:hypothetical protein
VSSGTPTPAEDTSQPTPPTPFELGRAAGVLIGLIAFTAGFAAAALLVLAGRGGGTPPYLVSITIGLVGVGLIGFFYHRGTADLTQTKIWSPSLLRTIITPLGLPVIPVIATLYLLAGIGLLGNLVVPLLNRG